ncbi:3601_t:CDS:2, partial [Racocetra persica]
DAVRSAEKHGRQCLSIQYTNNKDPLLWHCLNNHEWYAPLHRLKNHNKWCPTCGYDKRRLGILTAKELALSKNGKCISDSYINNQTPLIWECTEKLNLEIAKEVAISKRGQCLSMEYINIDKPLLWICQFNHQWHTSLNKVKNSNSWCPYCAGTKRLTLEEAKQIVYSRNGECLSEIFVNIRSPLLWKCAKGHKWHSTLKNVKNSNTWCPFCRLHKREKLCREIVSKYLGPPSENRWPGFLKTSKYPTDLELDIPYYYYGFAIEVQGEQHEKYNEFFHKGDPNNFIRQQERDQLKKELCKENWIVFEKF